MQTVNLQERVAYLEHDELGSEIADHVEGLDARQLEPHQVGHQTRQSNVGVVLRAVKFENDEAGQVVEHVAVEVGKIGVVDDQLAQLTQVLERRVVECHVVDAQIVQSD